MKERTSDPEDGMARLVQEATNQSTPEKALREQRAKPIARRKIAPKRTKAPEQ